jgi:hypothetical protein
MSDRELWLIIRRSMFMIIAAFDQKFGIEDHRLRKGEDSNHSRRLPASKLADARFCE